MPAKIAIDREQVKMLVIQIGVREAARRLGLKEDTVAAWSSRGRWLADLPRSQSLPATMVQPASNASTPAQILANELRALSCKTRLSHARAQAEIAAFVEVQKPEVLLDKAHEIKASVQTAAILHGWAANQAVTKVSLSITGAHEVSVEATSDAIDAEWSDEQVIGDESVEGI